ncbi:MAG: hypothetical protein V2A70_06165 [Candidatus Omnitrophota bacterium]
MGASLISVEDNNGRPGIAMLHYPAAAISSIPINDKGWTIGLRPGEDVRLRLNIGDYQGAVDMVQWQIRRHNQKNSVFTFENMQVLFEKKASSKNDKAMQSSFTSIPLSELRFDAAQEERKMFMKVDQDLMPFKDGITAPAGMEADFTYVVDYKKTTDYEGLLINALGVADDGRGYGFRFMNNSSDAMRIKVEAYLFASDREVVGKNGLSGRDADGYFSLLPGQSIDMPIQNFSNEGKLPQQVAILVRRQDSGLEFYSMVGLEDMFKTGWKHPSVLVNENKSRWDNLVGVPLHVNVNYQEPEKKAPLAGPEGKKAPLADLEVKRVVEDVKEGSSLKQFVLIFGMVVGILAVGKWYEKDMSRYFSSLMNKSTREVSAVSEPSGVAKVFEKVDVGVPVVDRGLKFEVLGIEPHVHHETGMTLYYKVNLGVTSMSNKQAPIQGLVARAYGQDGVAETAFQAVVGTGKNGKVGLQGVYAYGSKEVTATTDAPIGDLQMIPANATFSFDVPLLSFGKPIDKISVKAYRPGIGQTLVEYVNVQSLLKGVMVPKIKLPLKAREDVASRKLYQLDAWGQKSKRMGYYYETLDYMGLRLRPEYARRSFDVHTGIGLNHTNAEFLFWLENHSGKPIRIKKVDVFALGDSPKLLNGVEFRPPQGQEFMEISADNGNTFVIPIHLRRDQQEIPEQLSVVVEQEGAPDVVYTVVGLREMMSKEWQNTNDDAQSLQHASLAYLTDASDEAMMANVINMVQEHWIISGIVGVLAVGAAARFWMKFREDMKNAAIIDANRAVRMTPMRQPSASSSEKSFKQDEFWLDPAFCRMLREKIDMLALMAQMEFPQMGLLEIANLVRSKLDLKQPPQMPALEKKIGEEEVWLMVLDGVGGKALVNQYESTKPAVKPVKDLLSWAILNYKFSMTPGFFDMVVPKIIKRVNIALKRVPTADPQEVADMIQTALRINFPDQMPKDLQNKVRKEVRMLILLQMGVEPEGFDAAMASDLPSTSAFSINLPDAPIDSAQILSYAAVIAVLAAPVIWVELRQIRKSVQKNLDLYRASSSRKDFVGSVLELLYNGGDDSWVSLESSSLISHRRIMKKTLVAMIIEDVKNTITTTVDVINRALAHPETREEADFLREVLLSAQEYFGRILDGSVPPLEVSRSQSMVAYQAISALLETVSQVKLATLTEIRKTGLFAGLHTETGKNKSFKGVLTQKGAVGVSEVARVMFDRGILPVFDIKDALQYFKEGRPNALAGYFIRNNVPEALKAIEAGADYLVGVEEYLTPETIKAIKIAHPSIVIINDIAFKDNYVMGRVDESVAAGADGVQFGPFADFVDQTFTQAGDVLKDVRSKYPDLLINGAGGIFGERVGAVLQMPEGVVPSVAFMGNETLDQFAALAAGYHEKVEAVASDNAQYGGIDIKNIDVNKTGTSKIQFNEEAVREVLKNGFNGFTPVIINITPIASPLVAMGITDPSIGNTPEKQEMAALVARKFDDIDSI